MKKNVGNTSDDKKKRKEAKAHVTKDDSGSKSAAIACNSPTPQNTFEKVSITWDNKTLSEKMAAGIDDKPFCFDTGATSHISPVKGDFVKLKPIAPSGHTA